MRPRTPPPPPTLPSGAPAAEERCWRTRVLTRESIRVSRSASLIAGRVKSRTSKVTGRMEGKYRWKKMRFRTPGYMSFYSDWNTTVYSRRSRNGTTFQHIAHRRGVGEDLQKVLWRGFAGLHPRPQRNEPAPTGRWKWRVRRGRENHRARDCWGDAVIEELRTAEE